MRFEVLGRLGVVGEEPIAVRRPSHRRLLELLLLEEGRRLASEVLIDRFWGGTPPATAKAALHTHISALRKLIGADRIVTEEDGYQLAVDTDEVDVFAFEELGRKALTEVATHDPADVLAAAHAALSLWRGPPFRELADDEFARPTIVRMEELRLELLELRASALLALDRASEAVPDLEALVIEHPFRERLWEHLMTARFRLGRIGEALRTYRAAADHLAEIGLEPGESLRRLEERILLEGDARQHTPHNLPDELDEFVGRVQEVEETSALLDANRSVTITGPGGSGKTRLALHIARERLATHVDGVWFVDLAPTRDPELVATEVARAMGLQPRDDDVIGFLGRATASADVLIVLDNCEHLIEPTAVVVERLLRASPRLRILATSREPIRTRGEAIYELHGLTVPDPDDTSVTQTLETDAVRLFAARAGRTMHSFEFDDAQVAAVAAICRRLDGLPLAIELAAARSRAMAPTDISDRLDDHLGLLTSGSATAPERQQTLEATIDWSYRLLDGEQRTTLNRLSVFRGGFGLEAAERVATAADADSVGIARIVAELADKSLLVSQDTSRGRRYRLLETVRQYAEARFRETTHAMSTYARHRDWCLSLVEHLWERALGEERSDLGIILTSEADNLQGALDWCRAMNDERRDIAVLAQALGWHWYLAGHLSTAAARLYEALDAAATARESALTRALLARCLTYAEDLQGAGDVAREAVSRIDEVDRPYEKVWIIESEHNIHWMSLEADPAAMLPLASQAQRFVAGSGDGRARARAEQLVADARCWNGDTEEGLQHQRAAIEEARSTGDPAIINEIYGSSLYNCMLDGDARQSEPIAILREWQDLITFTPDTWRSRATDWLPWVYMQVGDLEAAEDAVSRIGNRTLQGYNRTIYFIGMATVAWMRGLTEKASAAAAEVGAGAIHRWAHCYYPLMAEIAADEGSLEETERLAHSYLSMPVHPTREAPKLGVLYPLVRAAVDRARRTGSKAEAELATATVSRMRDIVAMNPPLVRGWTSILTHEENLALADAELSRLGSPRPRLWRDLAATLDYRYYEVYARWRLGEALVATGDTAAAHQELTAAREVAARAGMAGLESRIAQTAGVADAAAAAP